MTIYHTKETRARKDWLSALRWADQDFQIAIKHLNERHNKVKKSPDPYIAKHMSDRLHRAITYGINQLFGETAQ